MNPEQLRAQLQAAVRRSFGWRRMTRTFVSGLIAVMPVLITFAVLMWLIGAAETVLGGVLRVLLPAEAYRPGMGLVFTFVLIFVVGMLMQAFFFREFVKWMEEQLERIPLIKTVYGAVRDLTSFFSKNDERRFGQVVIAQLPNLPVRMLGFVTVNDLSKAGLPGDEDTVAVYFPMSYQIGGYTLLLPRSCLAELDMSFEDAMRFLITAGLSRTDEAQARTPAGIVLPP